MTVFLFKILTNSAKNSNRELHKLKMDHMNWPTMINLQMPLNSLINLKEKNSKFVEKFKIVPQNDNFNSTVLHPNNHKQLY